MQARNDSLEKSLLVTHQQIAPVLLPSMWRFFENRLLSAPSHQYCAPLGLFLAAENLYPCYFDFIDACNRCIKDNDQGLDDKVDVSGLDLLCLIDSIIFYLAIALIWAIMISRSATHLHNRSLAIDALLTPAYLDSENTLNDQLTELENQFDDLTDEEKQILIELNLATKDNAGNVLLKFFCPLKRGLIATPLLATQNDHSSCYELSLAIKAGIKIGYKDFQNQLPITALTSSTKLKTKHRKYILALSAILNRLRPHPEEVGIYPRTRVAL